MPMTDKMKEHYEKITELYRKKYNADPPTFYTYKREAYVDLCNENVGWCDAEINCKFSGSFYEFKNKKVSNYWHQYGICDGGFCARVETFANDTLVFSFDRDNFCYSDTVKHKKLTVSDIHHVYNFYVLDKELFIVESGCRHEDAVNREIAVRTVKDYQRYVVDYNIEIFLKNGKPVLSDYTPIARDRGPGHEEKLKERDAEYDRSLKLPTIADIINQSIDQFEKSIPLAKQKFVWTFPSSHCIIRKGHLMNNRTPEYFDMTTYMKDNQVQYDGSKYIFGEKTFAYKFDGSKNTEG